MWSAKDNEEGTSWVFITVPEDVSDDLRDLSGPPRGFGSVRVQVCIGATEWATSLFPSQELGTYVLPVKKAVRRAEDVETGDVATVSLDLPRRGVDDEPGEGEQGRRLGSRGPLEQPASAE